MALTAGELQILVNVNTKEIESSWATLHVTMPKNRAIQTPFKWFLQQYPNLFLLLKILLQRLGQNK